VYTLPEVGMLTTLVYRLSGKCEDWMKTEKRSDVERLVCPTSRKQAQPCRYEFHVVCNRTDDDDVSSTTVYCGIHERGECFPQ